MPHTVINYVTNTLLLLAFLCCTHATAAGLYKCDANSNIRYQDRPCNNAAAQTTLTSQTVPNNTVVTTLSNHFQIVRDAQGRIKRSAAAKNAFKATHPCPATGKWQGACPGYVIDHIHALACGGADSPENMQWQTVVDGKAKDAWERRDCAVVTPVTNGLTASASPSTIASPIIRIGKRGGRYIFSKNGKKRYLPRQP